MLLRAKATGGIVALGATLTFMADQPRRQLLQLGHDGTSATTVLWRTVYCRSGVASLRPSVGNASLALNFDLATQR